MIRKSVRAEIQDCVFGRVAEEADCVEGLYVITAFDAVVVFFGAVVDVEHAVDAFVEVVVVSDGVGRGYWGDGGRARGRAWAELGTFLAFHSWAGGFLVGPGESCSGVGIEFAACRERKQSTIGPARIRRVNPTTHIQDILQLNMLNHRIFSILRTVGRIKS